MEDFLLRRGWARTQHEPLQFEYRDDSGERSAWPVASLGLEEAGIYFCDHGGARASAAVLLRDLIDEALAYSDGTDGVVLISV